MRMWSAAHVSNVARVLCATCVMAGAHDTKKVGLENEVEATCHAPSCDL